MTIHAQACRAPDYECSCGGSPAAPAQQDEPKPDERAVERVNRLLDMDQAFINAMPADVIEGIAALPRHQRRRELAIARKLWSKAQASDAARRSE